VKYIFGIAVMLGIIFVLMIWCERCEQEKKYAAKKMTTLI